MQATRLIGVNPFQEAHRAPDITDHITNHRHSLPASATEAGSITGSGNSPVRSGIISE
ncbi:hypothetical protein PAXRUDRAFT_828539 [Paxillus rubicundulus Ve08.2h10]|uniref:Uncharacterized protein n=1 Tax=Paxillus rubicundulus Ve08.2h10 TaxID=930991 RepID=A0A0D0E161_9AGAM|nr:hypothetical protein PAXRUDRAFT_828539 [Paxillus rubicundulus Ve08.2h10]